MSPTRAEIRAKLLDWTRCIDLAYAMPNTYVPHLGAHCSMAVCGDIIRLGQYCTLALTNHVPLCIP